MLHKKGYYEILVEFGTGHLSKKKQIFSFWARFDFEFAAIADITIRHKTQLHKRLFASQDQQT